MGRKVLFNGKIIDFTETNNILNPESGLLNYGMGFFETVLYENRKLFFLPEHLQRLEKTAAFFKVKREFQSTTKELILSFINKEKMEDKTLRIKIITAPISSNENWDTVIFLKEYNRKNISFQTSVHEIGEENLLRNYKTTNYWHNLFWKEHYHRQNGCDEVLFINSHHNILEGSYTNILVIKDNNLHYTGKNNNYLKGIMQEEIIVKAKQIGFNKVISEENGISKELITTADEIILSNSLMIAGNIGSLTFSDEKITFQRERMKSAKKIRDFFLK